MNNPLVTVAIPTYNGAKRISTSLESVMNQDYKNIEILICDNASTDNTEEIVTNYLLKDNRIRYVRHETNIGIINNFNCIANLAYGKYVIRFADDDYMPQNYVKELIDYSNNYSDIEIYGPNVILKNGSNSIIAKYDRKGINLNRLNDVPYLLNKLGNRGISWSLIYGLTERNFLLQNPLVNEVEDPGTFYVFQAILKASVAFTNKTTVYKTEGGISSSIDKLSFMKLKSILKDTIQLNALMQAENTKVNKGFLALKVKLVSNLLIWQYILKISIYYCLNIIIPAQKLRILLNRIRMVK